MANEPSHGRGTSVNSELDEIQRACSRRPFEAHAADNAGGGVSSPSLARRPGQPIARPRASARQASKTLLRDRTWGLAVVTAGPSACIVFVLLHVPEHLGFAQGFVLGYGADVGDPLGRTVKGVPEGWGSQDHPLDERSQHRLFLGRTGASVHAVVVGPRNHCSNMAPRGETSVVLERRL